jgi:ABC-type sugar transport system, ATPase component
MQDYVLEMKNIDKTFGGVYALKDVSINLKKNEILAIVGENGAGKSTLMKILSGSYSCDSYTGEIIVNGVGRKFFKPKDAELAGIDMIYQEISVHLDLSIAENIFLGNLPVNKFGMVDWKKLYKDAGKYLEMVGLKVSPKQKVRRLGASEQQMVNIAKSLSKNPSLLILDEPTSPLTESETRTLFKNLVELKNRGISCIYISHKMKEVMEIADRITVLRDGCFISTIEREDTDSNKIIEDMIGRKIDKMFPKEKVDIGEEVLKVENLTVAHPYAGEKNIVENVAFSLRKGEILGLAGLVGSGRSEIVNAIFGSIKNKNGVLYLSGEKVQIKDPKNSIVRGMGLLTEDRKISGFVHTLDVKQNITLASLEAISKSGILNRKKEKVIGKSFIEKLRIKVNSEKDSINSLSGGNQQKVVLAKWLMRDLKVIMLDEPTRGIDVGAKIQIYNVMTEMAKAGVGIIMISSELPELLAMSDRIIVLAEGKIRAEFSNEEASEELFMKAATGLV